MSFCFANSHRIEQISYKVSPPPYSPFIKYGLLRFFLTLPVTYWWTANFPGNSCDTNLLFKVYKIKQVSFKQLDLAYIEHYFQKFFGSIFFLNLEVTRSEKCCILEGFTNYLFYFGPKPVCATLNVVAES